MQSNSDKQIVYIDRIKAVNKIPDWLWLTVMIETILIAILLVRELL
jgi:hypothetical protein